MSRVITDRGKYLEIARSMPLSQTISQVQELFDGDLKLKYKSE